MHADWEPVSNPPPKFVSANEDDTIPYYAHCISRTGSYLSKVAGVPEGDALAYLIAPPLEAMYALDAALKAADVKLAAFYGPPAETNQTSFSIKSAMAFRPLRISAGFGPAMIPMISPASLVLALAAPA